MKVLVACEFSGIVREAFKAKGCDAWSCDLLDTEIPGQHIKGDVLDVLGNGWDLMIAHPPCRYLSYAGNVWMKQPGRKENREVAMGFFMALANAPIGKICIENPPGYPRKAWRLPDQIIHPYHFGHPIRKATCLWLKGLPLLTHPEVDAPLPCYIDGVTGRNRHWVDTLSPKNRAKNRSRTFQGIADAMADQW